MKSVGVLSLGCKVNTYESEYVINELKSAGYEIKNFDDICDVYIINTCTVTNNSDSKSKKMIRQAIKRNPNACVVAMGCFVESNRDKLPEGIDVIIGNKDKSKIVDLIYKFIEDKERYKKIYNLRNESTFEDMEITNFDNHTRAFVKIHVRGDAASVRTASGPADVEVSRGRTVARAYLAQSTAEVCENVL